MSILNMSGFSFDHPRSDGLPAKRTRTEDDYFNADSDDDDGEKGKGGGGDALPYTPAPGSPGAKNDDAQARSPDSSALWFSAFL